MAKATTTIKIRINQAAFVLRNWGVYFFPLDYLWSQFFSFLFNVLPMPWLVEVRAKTEALGVTHQPFVNWRLYLHRSI